MNPDLVVRGRRVATPDGIAPASIHIEQGVIAAVRAWEDLPDGAEVIEAGETVVMPGLVDTHVHINEPGRTDWEGFETATRAAAAGGITTLVDMPLNSIPATTTREALHEKMEAAEGRCRV
ncbi:MAG TPA: amidohydrolase family protein, partial [Thermoanaerobaculia bacterium]|nr:amidohydrolase family protein [Thermoanaerobaculia bacterium]